VNVGVLASYLYGEELKAIVSRTACDCEELIDDVSFRSVCMLGN
jgi:hypothetical protein